MHPSLHLGEYGTSLKPRYYTHWSRLRRTDNLKTRRFLRPPAPRRYRRNDRAASMLLPECCHIGSGPCLYGGMAIIKKKQQYWGSGKQTNTLGKDLGQRSNILAVCGGWPDLNELRVEGLQRRCGIAVIACWRAVFTYWRTVDTSPPCLIALSMLSLFSMQGWDFKGEDGEPPVALLYGRICCSNDWSLSQGIQ